ncbi:MAG: glycosyltransferase [Phycisphaera sp.]|nr:MAG: glycosyltransferase [Phycisphaera sp.]
MLFMRILHVNFVPLVEGPARAGGVAGYMQNLALCQRDLGHTVGALSSGDGYKPDLQGRGLGRVHWRQIEPWRGIDRLRIVNSPILAPALWQFGRAEADGADPALEGIFSEIVTQWRADVVHFHTLEGLTASCIQAAKNAGSRVVMSLHNHHAFCPQVYLMRGRRIPCVDYEGGRACVECEQSIDIKSEQFRRAGLMETSPPSIEPPPLAPIMRFEEDGSFSAETQVLIEQSHALWQPLDNVPPDSDLARESHNGYGDRRRAMAGALSECDRVLAVSEFVRSLAVSMGVRESQVVVQPIGTLPCERLAMPKRGEHDPLRVVFLGFNNYYKGLAMFVDAIGFLPAALRSRVHLSAFGPGCPSIRERAEAIRPGLAGLEMGGPYSREDLPDLLRDRHIGIVPSVWWDNGPQTLMEFQARGIPVLGADLGGIPDRIEHGVNGLLFRGNDRRDAAEQLKRLLTERGLLGRLWGGTEPGPTIAEHSAEVVGVYEELLESSPRS